MHSSRMRAARSSSRHRGVCTHTPQQVLPQSRHPPRAGNPPEQATPQSRQPSQEQAPPRPAPTQLPPWVWAWTRSPLTSPLAVSLDQTPLNFPLGCGPGPDPPQLPPWVWAWKPARHAGIPPPPLSETCCKACWDTTCNACWDSTPPPPPPWTDTPVKT